jgi:hypothetical protein
MAYGTATQVAALARQWTNENGEFEDPATEDAYADPPVFETTEGTIPTLTQVEDWLDSISAHLNMALAQEWFITPIDQATAPEAHKAVSQIVVSLTADLVQASNSTGRFFTDRALAAGTSPMAAVLKEINNWAKANADGLAGLGVPQKQTSATKNVATVQVTRLTR